jgi:hypothetical protein
MAYDKYGCHAVCLDFAIIPYIFLNRINNMFSIHDV